MLDSGWEDVEIVSRSFCPACSFRARASAKVVLACCLIAATLANVVRALAFLDLAENL